MTAQESNGQIARGNKWQIDLTHSALSLYWQGEPERARAELAGLRAALDFIEEQVLGGER